VGKKLDTGDSDLFLPFEEIVGGKRLTPNQIVRQELVTVTDQITSVPLHLFNSRNNPYTGEPTIDRVMQDGDRKNV
jgi:hypothetical protein